MRLFCIIAIVFSMFPSSGVDVTFDGGAGQIGGSCALVEKGSVQILVDCGSFSGVEAGSGNGSETGNFSFYPKSVNALLVTHAHADHTGRIPKLMREGFRGDVYMTSPTRALLKEGLRAQAPYDNSFVRNWEWSGKSRMGNVHWRKECEWRRKIHKSDLSQMRGRYRDLEKILPKAKGCKVCSGLDVEDWMRCVKTVEYDEELTIGDLKMTFRPVGHLPGASAIYFRDGETSFLFSGDIGTGRSRLANPIPVSSKVDAVFMECTHGDRTIANADETEKEYRRFASVVTNALAREKMVWIPAFAMGGMQRVMFELARCGAQPTLLYSLDDSGNAITDYYLSNPQLFAKDAAGTWDSFASMHRNAKWKFEPRTDPVRRVILLTEDGMMDSGESYELLEQLLSDINVLVCLTGYQAPGTPGALLKKGRWGIKLRNGKRVNVRAAVESFECFSGHGDAAENDKWLGENVKSKIYLTHGDADALNERKLGLEKRFGADVEIVQRRRTYHLGPQVSK